MKNLIFSFLIMSSLVSAQELKKIEQEKINPKKQALERTGGHGIGGGGNFFTIEFMIKGAKLCEYLKSYSRATLLSAEEVEKFCAAVAETDVRMDASEENKIRDKKGRQVKARYYTAKELGESQGHIMVHERSWAQALQEEIAVYEFVFHEYLRAAGIVEENYDKSIELSMSHLRKASRVEVPTDFIEQLSVDYQKIQTLEFGYFFDYEDCRAELPFMAAKVREKLNVPIYKTSCQHSGTARIQVLSTEVFSSKPEVYGHFKNSRECNELKNKISRFYVDKLGEAPLFMACMEQLNHEKRMFSRLHVLQVRDLGLRIFKSKYNYLAEGKEEQIVEAFESLSPGSTFTYSYGGVNSQLYYMAKYEYEYYSSYSKYGEPEYPSSFSKQESCEQSIINLKSGLESRGLLIPIFECEKVKERWRLNFFFLSKENLPYAKFYMEDDKHKDYVDLYQAAHPFEQVLFKLPTKSYKGNRYIIFSQYVKELNAKNYEKFKQHFNNVFTELKSFVSGQGQWSGKPRQVKVDPSYFAYFEFDNVFAELNSGKINQQFWNDLFVNKLQTIIDKSKEHKYTVFLPTIRSSHPSGEFVRDYPIYHTFRPLEVFMTSSKKVSKAINHVRILTGNDHQEDD